MLERFFPELYISSIFALPFQELKKKGIRALVFDIDNTIVPFDVAEAEEEMITFFNSLRKDGFQLCLLSNNNKKRVRLFNQKLKVLAVYKAGKPGTKKLRRAMKKMQVTPEQTALIGDQIFTDVYCGHRAGVFTILTAPVCNRDQLVTKVKRGIERQVLKYYFSKH